MGADTQWIRSRRRDAGYLTVHRQKRTRHNIFFDIKVALTPLQLAVMAEFAKALDQILTRDYLLETFWKQPYEGSNRIDALMRSLRCKLGAFAPSIETVTGHGYRFKGRVKENQ